jgi:hypothetical protein
MMAEQLAAADRALSRFFFTNGEGGIRLFAAQPPMSVVTQLKDPCQAQRSVLRFVKRESKTIRERFRAGARNAYPISHYLK